MFQIIITLKVTGFAFFVDLERQIKVGKEKDGERERVHINLGGYRNEENLGELGEGKHDKNILYVNFSIKILCSL